MMFVKRLLILSVMITLGTLALHAEQLNRAWEHFQGVWANKDCELVRTAGYSLLFERDGSTLSAALQKVSATKNQINLNTRAKTVFDNSDESVTLKAKGLFDSQKIIIQHPPANECKLTDKNYSIEKTDGKVMLLENGQLREELDIEAGRLKMKRPDGRWQTLTKIEAITMTKPYNMPVDVTQDNVGKRIQEWQLGTRYWKDPDSVFWKIDIGTNQHLYTFTMNDNFLYCRAARIRSNNQGTVFSQNIRLVARGENRNHGYIGYMAPDNLEKAGSELDIDNTKFDSACGIAYDIDIYWSLHSYAEGEIKVNGCDQVYERRPSSKNDADMLEWITFKGY